MTLRTCVKKYFLRKKYFLGKIWCKRDFQASVPTNYATMYLIFFTPFNCRLSSPTTWAFSLKDLMTFSYEESPGPYPKICLKTCDWWRYHPTRPFFNPEKWKLCNLFFSLAAGQTGGLFWKNTKVWANCFEILIPSSFNI